MSENLDWASKITNSLIPSWSEAAEYRTPIAASHRKTKADGLRLIAPMFLSDGWRLKSNEEIIEQIHSIANKIEKGEI